MSVGTILLLASMMIFVPAAYFFGNEGILTASMSGCAGLALMLVGLVMQWVFGE